MSLKVILSSILVLVLASLVVFYFVPFNNLHFESNINPNFSLIGGENMQFYPNMRFQTTEISYQISDCPLQKKNDMEYAFDILENLTALNFYPVLRDEDISITCENKQRVEDGLFIAGEGGPTNVTSIGEFNIIFNGEILLIRDSKCTTPNIALHELLHVLGFDHSTNPENIMYSVTSCEEVIGDDLLNTLNALYAIPSYPDLIFQNVSASLSGKFLDINITIGNVGLNDAPASEIIIYSNSSIIKEFDLKPIDMGYGRIALFQNIFVPNSNINKLEIVINSEFNEISKENNKIELNVQD